VPCTNAHGNLIKLVTQPMTTYQAPALPWEFGACTKYLKRDTEQQRRPIMSVVHCAGNYSNHCQRLSFLAIHIQDQRFKHGQLLMLPNHPWSSFHPEPWAAHCHGRILDNERHTARLIWKGRVGMPFVSCVLKPTMVCVGGA